MRLRCLCSITLLQLVPGMVQESRAACDAVVLVQQEVQSFHTWSFSPQVIQSMLHSAAGKLHSQLEVHEAELMREMSEAQKVNKYVDKVRGSLGRKLTLFGDMAGIVPMGQMDESDRTVAMILLGLFRNREFAGALVTGVNKFAQSLQEYQWRAQKRVSSLVMESAATSEQELPKLIKGFFGNQHHMASNLLSVIDKGMKATLAALPAEYSVMRMIGGKLEEQLISHAAAVLKNSTELVTQSNGAKFCDGFDYFLREELLTATNRSVNALKVVDSFARVKLPEVKAEVSRLMEALEGVSAHLAGIYEESGPWIEKLCGLVGAASTS